MRLGPLGGSWWVRGRQLRPYPADLRGVQGVRARIENICFWCFQNVAKNPQPKLGRTSADLASRMSGVAEVVRFGRSDQGRDAEQGRDALSLNLFFAVVAGFVCSFV